MRAGIKTICFFILIGLPLGSIYTVSSMIAQLQSVSPCSSEEECQNQYIRNIGSCVTYGQNGRLENSCGDAIDPAYTALQVDWQIRTQKFADMANAEKQRLAPEVMQAKQAQIRQALKQRLDISETKVSVAESLFLAFLILPILCVFVDWVLAYKARKNLLQGEVPSTLIMFFLCVTLAAIVADLVTVLSAVLFSFNPGNFSLGGAGVIVGLTVLLIGLSYLLAKGIKTEFLRFRELALSAKGVAGK
jgi:hypothetical protein